MDIYNAAPTIFSSPALGLAGKYTSQPKGVVKPKPNQFLNYFRQSSENRSNLKIM